MKKDNLDTLFETLANQFDSEAPNAGHEARFLNKLKHQNDTAIISVKKKTVSLWKPLLGIAATVTLIIVFTFGLKTETAQNDLASISPEMAETQSFFSRTIKQELQKLNEEKTPEAQQLIKDATTRLNKLEAAYDALKTDLAESGDDKRVIYAMISNFQNRIEVLQTTLQKIEEIKQLKINENYESNTI
ncbi:hypothetical protein [Lacinutrix salivirga]